MWGALRGGNCLEELNDCQHLKEDLVYGVWAYTEMILRHDMFVLPFEDV